MNIYYLSVKDDAPGPSYEVNRAMVVLAGSPAAARKLAAERVIDEPRARWLDPSHSYCTKIGDAVGTQEPHVLVADNNAS